MYPIVATGFKCFRFGFSSAGSEGGCFDLQALVLVLLLASDWISSLHLMDLVTDDAKARADVSARMPRAKPRCVLGAPGLKPRFKRLESTMPAGLHASLPPARCRHGG